MASAGTRDEKTPYAADVHRLEVDREEFAQRRDDVVALPRQLEADPSVRDAHDAHRGAARCEPPDEVDIVGDAEDAVFGAPAAARQEPDGDDRPTDRVPDPEPEGVTA